MKKKEISAYFSKLAKKRHKNNPVSSDFMREIAKKRWEKTEK